MSQIYFKQNGEVISTVNQNKTKIDFALKFLMGGQAQLQSQQQEVMAFAEDLMRNGIIRSELELQELALKNPKKLQQLFQIWKQSGIEGVKQAIQQPQMAEKGAKLTYIKSLRGICPEGEELTYMLKGGVMCPVCKKKEGGEAPKAEKKEFFGKDKKVKKDQEGAKVKKTQQTPNDSITSTRRTNKYGDIIGTEQHDNGLTRSYVESPKLPLSPYWVDINNGDSIVSRVATPPYNKITPKERQDVLNFYNSRDTIPVLYKTRDDWRSAMFEKGGKMNKKEFFKKEPKAPLAKCGKKVMAKCGCKAKKKVKSNQQGGPLTYATSFIDSKMLGVNPKEPFKRNFTVYGKGKGFNNFTFSGDTPFGKVTNEFMHPIYYKNGDYHWFDFDEGDIGRYILNGDTVYWSGKLRDESNGFGTGGNQDSLKTEFYKQLNDKGTTTLYKESDKKDLQRLRKESKKK